MQLVAWTENDASVSVCFIKPGKLYGAVSDVEEHVVGDSICVYVEEIILLLNQFVSRY